jgi:hypothetical protein
MFSLPLRQSLRLRRCLHHIVLYSLGSAVYTDILLDSMIALSHYYMVWVWYRLGYPPLTQASSGNLGCHSLPGLHYSQ